MFEIREGYAAELDIDAVKTANKHIDKQKRLEKTRKSTRFTQK